MKGKESKAVGWRRKKNGDGKGKNAPLISVMVIMMVLIGFGGVIGKLNGGYQNVSQEGNGERISFEIKIPERGEKMRVAKEKVCVSDMKKEVAFPVISGNKKGLRVFSFIKNAARNETLMGKVEDNKSRINVSELDRGEKGVRDKNIETKAKSLFYSIKEVKRRDTINDKMTKAITKSCEEGSKLIQSVTSTPSIDKPLRSMVINVLDQQTANVTIDMPLPVIDSTVYAYMVELFHSEYEEGFKEGLEYLFDSKIVEYTMVEDSSNFSLHFDIILKGNYTSNFIIKAMPVKYTNYLPLDYDRIIVSKNSSTITTITNYVLSTECKVPLTEGVIAPSRTAPLQAITLPIENAENVYGLNSDSRFCIPDYWAGWGGDNVPGTGYTALEIAEMYKPYFVKDSDTTYPDKVFYRVYKGDDPYTTTTNDAILIMYYGFWCRQDEFPRHCNDAEQVYIWVNSVGEDPYKIAYDRWTLWDWHLHHVERAKSGDGATWVDIPNNTYDHDEIENVYSQHASYNPQGRRLYNSFHRWGDHPCQVLLNDIINEFDNHHLWVRIGTGWHTYDPLIYDNDTTSYTTYTLYPLDDETLIKWYTTYACCTDLKVCEFAADLSDPFHGLFWEDPNVCDPVFPLLSGFIDSAEMDMSNGTLTVNISAYYDNSGAGGTAGQKLRGLWKDRFYAYLVGEGNRVLLGEPFAMKEYSAGDYTLQFDDLPLGTYELHMEITDNMDLEWKKAWARAEEEITIEFEDDFEDPNFSLGAWVPNNGEWSVHVNESGNNYLWTTSPAADGNDPIIQLKGTSNWTDYTVETDFAFIDTGTEGAAAYIIGRDSIQIGETHPYGGFYIASVQIEKHGSEWKGNATVQRAYDANGDSNITQDELTVLAIENLNSDIISDLVNHYWCTLKVGFEGPIITVYVKTPSTGENLVLSVSDGWLTKGDIGLGASEAEGTTIKAAFDNVRASKGCIFNDQFENIRFSEGAWLVSSSTDCYITEIDGNGVMVIDDPAGEGPYAYVDQDFGTKNAVVEGVFNVSEDKSGQSHASVAITQNKGASYSLLYGFNAKTDDETFIIYWYDTETSEQGSAYKSYSFSSNQWYNFKLVIDNDNNMMYAYIDNRLELELDLPGSATGNISRVLLWDKYAKVLWDNIYVEQTPADTAPPTVSITSPGEGDTVSGVFTVETTVTDTGGSGINHTALYANDSLVAVNTTGTTNPIFKLDTATMDSGNCTLTAVAVDNAMNSNWTAISVDVNKLPVANFTYSPKNPTTADNITFDASESYDPDGNITAYDWDFGDGNTSSSVITTHRYSTAGNYTVNLTVTDDDGATDSTSKVITVPTGITTCEELQDMKNDLSGNYYLANDIDCSDTVNWNSGAGFEPIGNSSNPFTGTFDGGGHKITNLYINRPSTNNVGLFGRTGSGSEIKDVGLEDVDKTGGRS